VGVSDAWTSVGAYVPLAGRLVGASDARTSVGAYVPLAVNLSTVDRVVVGNRIGADRLA
jgi:hypothetical protein